MTLHIGGKMDQIHLLCLFEFCDLISLRVIKLGMGLSDGFGDVHIYGAEIIEAFKEQHRNSPPGRAAYKCSTPDLLPGYCMYYQVEPSANLNHAFECFYNFLKAVYSNKLYFCQTFPFDTKMSPSILLCFP